MTEKYKRSLPFWNASNRVLKVILEPYGTEFDLPAGSKCEIVGRSDQTEPDFSIEFKDDCIVFWGQTTGAVYTYWQDGVFID